MKKILISGIACSVLLLSSGCVGTTPVVETPKVDASLVKNERGIANIEHIKQAITILIKKMKILEEQKKTIAPVVPVISSDTNVNSEITTLDKKIKGLKILMDKEFKKCEKCCDNENTTQVIKDTPSQYDNIIKDFIEDGTLK